MEEDELELLFKNNIIVDAAIKDVRIDDIDELISILKKRNIFFLDGKTLYEINRERKKIENIDVQIVNNYDGEISQSKPQDWINFFNSRYNQLKEILMDRADRRLLVSAGNIKSVPDNSEVQLIGMVSNISISPIKKYMIIDVEDPTGICKVIMKNIDDELLRDQVILFKGKKSKDAIFVNEYVFPDIYIKDNHNLNIDDTYVAFLSDIHVGSALFAKDAFDRFIKWLNLEIDEYKDIAKKVRFLVLNGDLIDGIGIYPEQEKELSIKEVKKQYDQLYEFLSRVPKNIKLIINQGNHDATRIAEPQPILDPYFGESLYKLENAVFVSNPSTLDLIVEGFKRKLLIYHGFSIMYFINNINKLNQMREEDVAEVMRIMLKSRHLAPVHGSSQIVPLKKDYLVISETPDIFATGHVHKVLISKFKETVILNSSCWQFQTSYQKKYNILPEIAKVPLINLRDKSGIILDFLGEKVQEFKKGLI